MVRVSAVRRFIVFSSGWLAEELRRAPTAATYREPPRGRRYSPSGSIRGEYCVTNGIGYRRRTTPDRELSFPGDNSPQPIQSFGSTEPRHRRQPSSIRDECLILESVTRAYAAPPGTLRILPPLCLRHLHPPTEFLTRPNHRGAARIAAAKARGLTVPLIAPRSRRRGDRMRVWVEFSALPRWPKSKDLRQLAAEAKSETMEAWAVA